MYGEKFDKADYLKKFSVDTYGQIIKMLILKRNNVAIVNTTDFISNIPDEETRGKFYFLQPPVSEIHSYIGFSKKIKRKELPAVFASELMRFKTADEYRKMLIKYKLKQ